MATTTFNNNQQTSHKSDYDFNKYAVGYWWFNNQQYLAFPKHYSALRFATPKCAPRFKPSVPHRKFRVCMGRGRSQRQHSPSTPSTQFPYRSDGKTPQIHENNTKTNLKLSKLVFNIEVIIWISSIKPEIHNVQHPTFRVQNLKPYLGENKLLACNNSQTCNCVLNT